MEALDIYPDLSSRRKKTCIVTCRECFAREQKKTYASPGNRTMGMLITWN